MKIETDSTVNAFLAIGVVAHALSCVLAYFYKRNIHKFPLRDRLNWAVGATVSCASCRMCSNPLSLQFVDCAIAGFVNPAIPFFNWPCIVGYLYNFLGSVANEH